ncbi:hypothetical protein EVAR_25720_1 [Eumeta japonica]|uniref:Uncharacterized protein n=1 Tax=Eumeta variegata TaxID=151549 RepID=A0A4C1YU33_EUMVA|nr:hypothetical protein EVAR_25720_1 [Eumeta japonica]
MRHIDEPTHARKQSSDKAVTVSVCPRNPKSDDSHLKRHVHPAHVNRAPNDVITRPIRVHCSKQFSISQRKAKRNVEGRKINIYCTGGINRSRILEDKLIVRGRWCHELDVFDHKPNECLIERDSTGHDNVAEIYSQTQDNKQETTKLQSWIAAPSRRTGSRGQSRRYLITLVRLKLPRRPASSSLRDPRCIRRLRQIKDEPRALQGRSRKTRNEATIMKNGNSHPTAKRRVGGTGAGGGWRRGAGGGAGGGRRTHRSINYHG